MEIFLDFKDVSFSYHTKSGETLALKKLSFSVHEGEFVAIVGPSGCGKSTILSLIAGLLKPESGLIKLMNSNNGFITGYMLQRDHLFEWRTVYSNALLGLEIQGKKSKDNIEAVDNMLIRYGLMSFKKSRPSELSGGLRQRAALIRTLALKPELLLLDEPFSALDYQTRLAVGNDIGQIIKEKKKTAILVTHDLSEAISLGNRILVLSNRPAQVIYDLKLDFDDDLSALQKRSTSAFQEYFQLVWEVLNRGGD